MRAGCNPWIRFITDNIGSGRQKQHSEKRGAIPLAMAKLVIVEAASRCLVRFAG